MPLAMRDLVDPDATQTSQKIDLASSLVSDPFADLTDAAPRDAHQLAQADFDVLTASHAAWSSETSW